MISATLIKYVVDQQKYCLSQIMKQQHSVGCNVLRYTTSNRGTIQLPLELTLIGWHHPYTICGSSGSHLASVARELRCSRSQNLWRPCNSFPFLANDHYDELHYQYCTNSTTKITYQGLKSPPHIISRTTSRSHFVTPT